MNIGYSWPHEPIERLAVAVINSVDGDPPEEDQTDSEYVELVEKLFDSLAFLMYTPKVVSVERSEGAVND